MLGQDCETTEEKLPPIDKVDTTLGTTFDDKGSEAASASESTPVEPPKKYYDIDEIWAERASPNDELTRYTLSLRINDKILVAHMIVDPLVDITAQEIDYMIGQGFILESTSTVLRENLNENDTKLLRNSQYMNPDNLQQ